VGGAQTEGVLRGLLEPAEQARLERYRHRLDRLRGLAGALLVRTLLAEAYAGLLPPVGGFVVPRDASGRPRLPDAVLARDGGGSAAAFSVSHQGAYTVVAAHPARPVGVDVMDCALPPAGTTTDAFLAPLQEQVRPPRTPTQPAHTLRLETQLSVAEWAAVHAGAPTDLARLQRVYRLWALKESYAKAVGVGLGVPLATVTFAPTTPVDHALLWADTPLAAVRALHAARPGHGARDLTRSGARSPCSVQWCGTACYWMDGAQSWRRSQRATTPIMSWR
jgi:4'-phosphopantetheinyl transferase